MRITRIALMGLAALAALPFTAAAQGAPPPGGTVVAPPPTGAAPAPDRTAPGNPPIRTEGSVSGVQPVPGANSFTEEQARDRIAARGYAAISALVKDRDGIWRGRATKDGRTFAVALDYQGNVVGE
jgi:hypothetical protein